MAFNFLKGKIKMITSISNLNTSHMLRVAHTFSVTSHNFSKIKCIYLINYMDMEGINVKFGINVYNNDGNYIPSVSTHKFELKKGFEQEAMYRNTIPQINKRLRTKYSKEMADYILDYFYTKEFKSYLKNDLYNLLLNSLFKQLGV